MTGGFKFRLKINKPSESSEHPSGNAAPLSSDAKTKKRKNRPDDNDGIHAVPPVKKPLFNSLSGRTPPLSSLSSQQGTGIRFPLPLPQKLHTPKPTSTSLLNSIHPVSSPVSHGEQTNLATKVTLKLPGPGSYHRNDVQQPYANGASNTPQPRARAPKAPAKRQAKKPAAKPANRNAKAKDKVVGLSEVSMNAEAPIRLTLQREAHPAAHVQVFNAAEQSDELPFPEPLPSSAMQPRFGGSGSSNGGLDKGDVLKVVEYIQKKDPSNIFKNPVTDDEAPGYSDMIKQPMDFTTIRNKASSGTYQQWDDLKADVELMFYNCMKYNPSTTIYYKEARKLLSVSTKVFELAEQGIRNFRGRTNAIVRQHNQQNLKEELDMREKAKAAAPKPPAGRVASLSALQKDSTPSEQKEVPAPSLPARFKSTARPMVKDTDGRRPLMLDENLRTTYKQRAGLNGLGSVWGGLAGGVSTEGQPYASARPVLKHVANHPPAAYLHSIARFIAGCSDAVKEHVLGSLVDCIAVEAPKPKPTQPSPSNPTTTTPTQIALPAAITLPTVSQPQAQPQPASSAPLTQASTTPASQPTSAPSFRLPQAAHVSRPQPAFHHTLQSPSITASALQKHLQQQQQEQKQQQQLMLLQQKQDAERLKAGSSIFSALNQHALHTSEPMAATVYGNMHTSLPSSQALPTYQPSSSHFSKGLPQSLASSPYASLQHNHQQKTPSQLSSTGRSIDSAIHQQSFLSSQQHEAQLSSQRQGNQQPKHMLQQYTQQSHGQSLTPTQQQLYLHQQQQQQQMAASSAAGQPLSSLQYIQRLLPPR